MLRFKHQHFGQTAATSRWKPCPVSQPVTVWWMQTSLWRAKTPSSDMQWHVGRPVHHNTNLPSLPVCRVVYPFFTTSTRLPVFLNFYPFWEFRFQKTNPKKKKKICCLFLPVNIGEIRELINHFRSYRP